MAPTTFLTLPREIRDQVLQFLTTEDEHQPPTVLYARKWNTLRDENDPTAPKILHSSLPFIPRGIHQLSLVNRQLYHEVRERLRSIQITTPEQPALKLDLLLDDLHTYYVSWLKVLPYTGPVVSTLHVTIRPFFALRYTRDVIWHTTSMPMANHLGISYACQGALWRLGSVINSVLSHGPASMMRMPRSSVRGVFIIERLVIDIQTTKINTQTIDANDIECSTIAAEQGDGMRAFMLSDLENFFTDRVGGAAHVPWGPLFLARVRKLVVVNGDKVLRSFDITAYAKEKGVSLWTV